MTDMGWSYQKNGGKYNWQSSDRTGARENSVEGDAWEEIDWFCIRGCERPSATDSESKQRWRNMRKENWQTFIGIFCICLMYN